jgi:prepilin-type N-terminal cleavage/methylation domain-containing protein
MASRRVQGFTLIELMVVATIIGVSVVAFTPSFVNTVSDRRAAAAVAEVVRLGRQARSYTMGTSRAHLVSIRPGFGVQGAGLVQLLRGVDSHCDLQNWQTLSATCGPLGLESDSRTCLEQVDLNNERWHHDPHAIRLRTVLAGREAAPDLRAALQAPEGTSYSICHEPNGTTHWAVGPLANPITNFSELNNGQMAGGAMLFTIGVVHNVTNAVENTPRVFAYPLGTTPRRLR